MSKNAHGLPSRVGSVVLCALVLGAAPVARGRGAAAAPSDTQKTPAQACTLWVQIPFEEVHPASNLPSFLSVSWSGLDFRSFHRQLPIALKRQAGETVELLLETVAGDGSVRRGSCRATVILRGVALPAV